MTARDHCIRIEGRRVHWRERGRGRPIVLLHGLGHSVTAWRKVAPQLARGHRVVAVDLPGFGASDHLDERPLLDAQSELLARFLEQLGIRSAMLVGHSMGGAIALRLAAQRPDLVSELVLVAPAGVLRTPLWWRVASLRRPIGLGLLPFRWLISPALVAGAFGVCYRYLGFFDGAAATEEELRDFLAPLGSHQSIHRWLEVADDVVRSMIPPWSTGLGEERSVLVVWGRQDRLTPSCNAEPVARLLGARVVMIEECGHSPHLEQPEAFLEALNDFAALQAPARTQARSQRRSTARR